MEKKRRWLVVGLAVFLCFSIVIGVAADGITIYLPLVVLDWVSSPPPATETVIYLGDPIVVEGSGAVVSGNSVTIVDDGAYRVVGVLADGLLDVNTAGAVELILGRRLDHPRCKGRLSP